MLYNLLSEVEEVLATKVKVELPKSRNTRFQVYILHSKCYLKLKKCWHQGILKVLVYRLDSIRMIYIKCFDCNY